MSPYRRPWWLLVNKPAGLITTIQEESRPGERVFIVHGDPLVQGLAWLTWGPVAALVVILILAILAITLDVKEQPGAVRAAFIAAFLGLPALAWAGMVVLMTRLSRPYLQAEREAGAQEQIIRLEQGAGRLTYQSAGTPSSHLPYQDIYQIRTSHALGQQEGTALRLIAETGQGQVVLLNEMLGTPVQKADLAREIQEALNAYANKIKSPSS